MKRVLLLLFAMLVASIPAAASDCRYDDDLTGTLSAAGVTEVEIIARAGSLRVIGKDGLTQINAKGKACASRESYLDDMRLRTTKRGSTAIIEVEIPDIRSFFGGWNNYRSMDLVVELPAGIAVNIDDSSGSMEVRGVGDLFIDDSSGDIEVFDISGSVEIRDNSGGMELTQIAGDVRINDGSGSIDIRKVSGSVVIEDDGSGSIDISDVVRDVVIEDDGSGSIHVSQVGGDFIVRDDGSGGIRFDGVEGRVRIPRD